jgi:hypothetical protein
MKSPPEFYTAGDLRRRVWTEKLIRDFAGLPDDMAVNPHHPGGPMIRLWRSERIEEIETSELFREARGAAQRRMESAQKGLQTKAKNAAASVSGTIPPPVLPPAPRAELIAAAVQWFNQVHTWRTGSGKWLSGKEADSVLFPVVVEFIRDGLNDYRKRARPIGLPIAQALAAVDQTILDAIAERYPWLSVECRENSVGGRCGDLTVQQPNPSNRE